MNTVMQWLRARRGRDDTMLVELPHANPDDHPNRRHWCVIVGGIALILSRATPHERANRFAQAHALHDELREKLAQRVSDGPSPEMLNEAMHEIAEIADPMTRASLNACLHACARGRGGTREPHHRQSRGEGSTASSRSTGLRSRSFSLPEPARKESQAQREAAETVLSSDIMQTRSQALRRSINSARTGFSELR